MHGIPCAHTPYYHPYSALNHNLRRRSTEPLIAWSSKTTNQNLHTTFLLKRTHCTYLGDNPCKCPPCSGGRHPSTAVQMLRSRRTWKSGCKEWQGSPCSFRGSWTSDFWRDLCKRRKWIILLFPVLTAAVVFCLSDSDARISDLSLDIVVFVGHHWEIFCTLGKFTDTKKSGYFSHWPNFTK